MISLRRGAKYLCMATAFLLLAGLFALAFAVVGIIPALLLVHLVNLSLSVLGQGALSDSHAGNVNFAGVVLAALFGVYLAQRIGRTDLRRSHDADWNQLGAFLDAIAAAFSFRR
jgi:hypothetical protein